MWTHIFSIYPTPVLKSKPRLHFMCVSSYIIIYIKPHHPGGITLGSSDLDPIFLLPSLIPYGAVKGGGVEGELIYDNLLLLLAHALTVSNNCVKESIPCPHRFGCVCYHHVEISALKTVLPQVSTNILILA